MDFRPAIAFHGGIDLWPLVAVTLGRPAERWWETVIVDGGGRRWWE
jgi:hypothetical protein